MSINRLFAILILCLPLAACDTPTSGAQTQLPQIKVKLPPPPTFEKKHAPEKYADGTFSVYGVRENIKDTLNKEVRVRGFIIEVYQCPPCPKGKECPECDKTHFWLSDRANGPKDKALMVVDYPKKDPKTRKKLKFLTGVQYYVGGQFSKRSVSGFSSSEGLVVYNSAEVVSTE